MRIITIAALAALSLNAHSIEYVPDPDVAFDIIQMHDTTTWEKVCESYDGVCDVPEGTYQVKLLDRNWKELVRLRDVSVQHSSSQALDICILYSAHPELPAPDYCPAAPTYVIGDTGPGGGIVFHVTNGGLNGLEAALEDQPSAEWGCHRIDVAGVDNIHLLDTPDNNTGAENTALLVAACGANTAAGAAANYVLGTVDDWFLPNKEELLLLSINLNMEIGGLLDRFYWSSSEWDFIAAEFAWAIFGGSGDIITTHKLDSHTVRAVRAF